MKNCSFGEPVRKFAFSSNSWILYRHKNIKPPSSQILFRHFARHQTDSRTNKHRRTRSFFTWRDAVRSFDVPRPITATLWVGPQSGSLLPERWIVIAGPRSQQSAGDVSWSHDVLPLEQWMSQYAPSDRKSMAKMRSEAGRDPSHAIVSVIQSRRIH